MDFIQDVEIEKRDERRMDKIRFRRSGNGLYLKQFETKEQTYKYLKQLAKKYRHSTKYTLKTLCQWADNNHNVTVYPKFLSRVFRQAFNITIRYVGNKTNKETTTFRLSPEVVAGLQPLADEDLQSWYAEIMFRLHMGMDSKWLMVFLQDELRKNAVSVLICQTPKSDEWVGLQFGRITNETQRLIDNWCYDAEENGLDYLERKLKVKGHFTLGNVNSPNSNNSNE